MRSTSWRRPPATAPCRREVEELKASSCGIIAQCLLRKGHVRAAGREARLALPYDPTHPPALLVLGRAESHFGRPDAAVSALEPLVAQLEAAENKEGAALLEKEVERQRRRQKRGGGGNKKKAPRAPASDKGRPMGGGAACGRPAGLFRPSFLHPALEVRPMWTPHPVNPLWGPVAWRGLFMTERVPSGNGAAGGGGGGACEGRHLVGRRPAGARRAGRVRAQRGDAGAGALALRRVGGGRGRARPQPQRLDPPHGPLPRRAPARPRPAGGQRLLDPQPLRREPQTVEAERIARELRHNLIGVGEGDKRTSGLFALGAFAVDAAWTAGAGPTAVLQGAKGGRFLLLTAACDSEAGEAVTVVKDGPWERPVYHH